MEFEDKNVGIQLDCVESVACGHCGCEIDLSGVEPFHEVVCPACSHQSPVPARLGHFLLQRLIGTGGMGGIYYAKDETLDRFVAIKVMLKSLGEDPDFVQSFKREAQAAAQINHPHIAQIYSFGQEKGQPYIVMELVTGQKFSAMVDSGEPMDQGLVMKVAMEVAEGLQAANEAGLIHGDIKPENILLDEKMQAKLVDFGLASHAHQQAADGIWGTPYYIAPEKIRRQPADFRSDIYSLGATLYHALTGHPPFEGQTPVEVVKARLERSPAELRTVRADINEDVERIVARMLQVEPGMRYPTYASLLGDLRKVVKALVPAEGITPSGKIKSRKMIIKKGGTRIRIGGRAAPEPSPYDALDEYKKSLMGKPKRSGTVGKVFLILFLVAFTTGLLIGAGVAIQRHKDQRERLAAARRLQHGLLEQIAAAEAAHSDVQRAVTRVIASAGSRTNGLAEQATNIVFVTLATVLVPFPDAPRPVALAQPGVTTNKPAAVRRKPDAPLPPEAVAGSGVPDEQVPAGLETPSQLRRRHQLEQQRKLSAEKTVAEKAVEAAAATNAPPPEAPPPPPPDDRPLVVMARTVIEAVKTVRANVAKAREIGARATEERAGAQNATNAAAAQVHVGLLKDMTPQVLALVPLNDEAIKKAEKTLEDMRKEQKSRVKQREEDARKQAELDARQRRDAELKAKLDGELAAVASAEAKAMGLAKSYNFREGADAIAVTLKTLETDEARKQCERLALLHGKLRDLKAYVIERLTAEPFRWGWVEGSTRKDVVGADENVVRVTGGQVPWPRVLPGQFVSFAEHYLSKPDVKSKVAGEQYLALAVYFLINAKEEQARTYRTKALRAAPFLQEDAEKLIPAG